MSTSTQGPGSSEEMLHFVEASRDALTDEMVTRIAQTASDAMDLMDRVNRSGLARAIPTLAEIVNNGDLERLVALARVYASAEDALSDEMVARLSEAVGGGLSLLDRINRSDLEKAIPALSRMVADGDLERLARMARVIGAAEDALTDETIGRLAETLTEGLSLLDRLNRGGAGRMVEMLARLEAGGSLERIATTLPRLLERMESVEHLLEAFDEATSRTAGEPPANGGIGGMWSMMRDKDNQEAMRHLINIGKALRGGSGTASR